MSKKQDGVWSEYGRRAKRVRKAGKALLREMNKVSFYLNMEAMKARAPWESSKWNVSPMGKRILKSKVDATEGELNALLAETEDAVRWELLCDQWSSLASLMEKVLDEALENTP
jgi:hypothetical protein